VETHTGRTTIYIYIYIYIYVHIYIYIYIYIYVRAAQARIPTLSRNHTQKVCVALMDKQLCACAWVMYTDTLWVAHTAW
jgi:hypothetical protein